MRVAKQIGARRSLPRRTQGFRVGESVSFRMGLSDARGTIVEDRGPIGVSGRHLYSVEFHRAFDETPHLIELPESDIRRVA